MNVAMDGVEALLAAEEQANRIAEELTRLKEETESYRTAGKALDQAGKGVGDLAIRLADIAGRLGGVVETMRSIGTPELLSGQETIGNELARLHQGLTGTQQSVIEAVSQTVDQVRLLSKTIESTEQAHRLAFERIQQDMRDVRKMTIGMAGMLALALACFFVLSFGRG
jgi:DNA anti-recombination protein RmuC